MIGLVVYSTERFITHCHIFWPGGIFISCDSAACKLGLTMVLWMKRMESVTRTRIGRTRRLGNYRRRLHQRPQCQTILLYE